MVRSRHQLTDVKVKAAKKAGRHADGGGLYLSVSTSGTKSWVFMWTAEKKRTEMGLGAYPAISLATARQKSEAYRTTVAAGGDPKADRDKEAEPTFADAADKFLASMQSSWRNEKHREQWKMTLTEYCKDFREKRVSLVRTDDVLKALTPIWQSKPETASRLRGRIERVLDFARAKGWRTGENPALWRGHLKSVLPARKKLSRGHHAAMPYTELPAFVVRLRAAEAMSARALEFLILTAARSGEVYGADWKEFDLDAGVWTVPPERMKAGTEHRVPLSKRALQLVKQLHDANKTGFVFPGQGRGKPLSSSAMEMLLRRLKVDQYTVHGFRSAFRDWAGDETHFSREVAEAALAHSVGNAVEAAYRRSDALEKRRKLMQAWADYVGTVKAGNVTQFRKK